MDQPTVIADLEHRLAMSEARHRLLIGSWAQAEWETDAHGVVVVDSPSWRAYTGQTMKQWLGYGWLDAIHPDERAYAEQQWREAIANCGLVNAEFRLRAPEGGWRWTNVRAAPVLDEAGNIEKWAGINIDIHDRKRAEAALRESEERQAFLLKLSDSLRGEPNDDAVVDLATRMLAEDMGLDRCYAAAIYTAEDRVDIVREFRRPDLTPMPLHLRYSDYPEGAKQSYVQTLVFHDSANDPALTDLDKRSLAAMSFGALISPPLRHGAGKPIWAMGAVSTQPRRWTPSEVALVEEVAERTWAAVERARAEKALRESEERLRTLFDSIDEGYLEMDVVMGPDGRALDWRYIFLNPAFQRLSGLPDMTGRLASEFLPNLEPEWAERFAQVVTTGEAARFDFPAAQLDRWFEVYVVRPGGSGTTRLVMVYNNIIERKRAEQALRENEARQAFLLALSDALRAEPSADAAADYAIRMLFDQIGLDRCYLATFRIDDNRADITHQTGNDRTPPIPATLRISDFPEAFRTFHEQTLVVDDMAGDRSMSDADRQNMLDLGFGALLVPTLRNGARWALVAVSARPRRWTPDEIALVEEVSERAWAAIERAHAEAALRESEERFAQFAASSYDALWIRDAATLAMEFTSPAIQPIYGISPDAILGDMQGWVELIVPEDRDTAIAHIEQARAGASVTHEFRIRRPADGEIRWIRNTDFPLRDTEGRVQRIGGIAQDITEAKRSDVRLEVLVNELQHRARNLLGVVTAIADRTVKQGGSVEGFEVRLQALSRAQGLLSQGGSDTVAVGALVQAELAAHANGASGRISIAGPEVHLTARQVQNFALAMHELTTNAVKYGALRHEAGRLAVSWQVMLDQRGRRRLALTWVESGVPLAPDTVLRRGYGTELIQEALAYALQATVAYERGSDGVRCRIEMPIS